MAAIHHTTMTPTKIELLTAWLPGQPWYAGGPGAPELVKAGGFRLDDPEGEVGIELMVVVDTAGPEPVAYLVPLGYRGAALEGASEEALIGTSEHGVLGTRWIYDGVRDPVVTAQVRALLRGEAVPQHQDHSDTPDPTVTVHGAASGEPVELRISRVLRPTGTGEDAPGDGGDEGGAVRLLAGWTRPDGTPARAVFATAVRRG
ncbi:maltokinase N-terminal cap-like domain-containing protein [Kitasatospora camelliae]|uniref:1,4-alpha-glucan branching protein n=1 Tax=Kitasatospora camelliae TaxID=3156397 RepID=A0AAU8K4M9_9ACTN